MSVDALQASQAPAAWPTTTLGEIASIYSGSTPSRGVPGFWGGEIPWVTPGELTSLGEKYLTRTRDQITRAGLASCAASLVPKDALLVTTRATLGAAALAGMPVTTNQGFRSLVFNGAADPHFYFHISPLLLPELTRRASGTTFLEISGREFAAVSVPLPPLPEQRRIAEILDTLDEAIGATEEAIAKLRQVKQGLLHDLLTLGIDEHGELRDPDRHPEQFKDSPLGRIPKEWGAGSLAQFYASASRNGLYKPSSYHGRGPLMVQMGGIFRGAAVDFSDAGRVQVSASELQTFGLREGDLLFGRRSLVLEGAGRCALVRNLPEPATFESSIVRVRVDANRLRPAFAALYLQSGAAYLQRRKFIRQVAVSGVSGGDIAQFPMPQPPAEEQVLIESAHAAAEVRVDQEQRELKKLRTLKHGLMDDLLTGRVRVPVHEEASP